MGRSRMNTFMISICILGSALGQYSSSSSSSEEAGLPKKSPAIRRYKSQPPQHQSNSRFSNSAPQTSVANQRFRRPITVNKARPTSEPIPELPVFTSGIRGSHPPRLTPISVSTSPVPLSSYEQNDEAASLPIQTIQQPHLVHAQSIHSPQAASAFNELKPVNEEHDKDEDVVQVIANLGAVSGNAFTGNLLSPTIASPTPTLTAYLQAQHQQQLQQLQQQQQQQQHNQHAQQTLPPAPQYRPIQRPQPQSTPAEPQIHQIITPVQYKPQKPIRLQKQPQQQQQHHHQVQQQQHREHQHHHQQQPQQQQLTSRNEYDFNENSRPVISKPRPTAVPKKSKPQEYYGEGGRTKKPVAQVIRRYNEERPDGTIVWGFENDDGSFKEEMIGIDCITRGKYGYVDPDGLRREYTYETGIKCDDESQQQQQDQDILNTFVDYQENKLVLPNGRTIDLSSMGKKQSRRPQPLYRN
ncbi:hypothetical protein TKK_0001970 [Trichogramma kaykai]